MTRHDYACRVFTSYLRIFTRHKKRAKEGRGIEPLHHIRVTTRKLRNALGVFKEICPRKKRVAWKNSLRQLAKVSSLARDMDIQIAFLGNLKRQPIRREFLPVIARLQERLKVRREKLQPRIASALDRLEKTRLLEQLKKFFRSPKAVSPVEEVGEGMDIPQMARKRILKRLNKFFAYESFVDRPECSEELHRLRIAAKHLRYTLEDFELLYGKRIVPYIESVRSIQSVLGKLHDYDVWICMLPTYYVKRAPAADWNEAIDYLLQECRQARDTTYRQFYDLWYELRRKKVWSALEKILTPQ